MYYTFYTAMKLPHNTEVLAFFYPKIEDTMKAAANHAEKIKDGSREDEQVTDIEELQSLDEVRERQGELMKELN